MDKYENTPLIKSLHNHVLQGRINMHMPGHKQGMGLVLLFKIIFSYDLTELPGLDNYHNPTGAILKSMEACSEALEL